MTVSQCIRRLLDQGTEPRSRPASALDEAIAVLQSVRRSIDPESGAPQRPDAAPVVADAPGDRVAPGESTLREVNVLNAKANLSRLVADVERGEEVVIVHAGAPRARLVPVDGVRR